MSMIMAMPVTEAQQRRAVPIHGVSFDLFSAQVGSEDLAHSMRKAEWIFPCCLKPLLFDTGDVAGCWARICNGEHPKVNKGGGVRRAPVNPKDV